MRRFGSFTRMSLEVVAEDEKAGAWYVEPFVAGGLAVARGGGAGLGGAGRSGAR